MSSAVFFQIQSTLIVILLLWGVYKRRDRSLHPKIMFGVIGWDVLLILQIELTRGAVAKASRVVTNETLLNIHVSLAVATVLFYIAMIWSGRRLLKGKNSLRSLHKRLGFSTLILRLLTYATSFFAVSS